MAFVTQSENFFDGNGAGFFPEFLEVLDCSIDLFLSNAGLRDDPGDGLSVARNDDGLAALHLIEEPGKMRFGFGGLNFSRHEL
jgi:hypothetical protein